VRSDASGRLELDRWNIPYVLHQPPGRVLIVGAGSGNDAAAALRMGAGTVTAVDIDPTILRLGQAFHPQRPYADPRVELVVDDARHYLKSGDRPFDVIVFSHLDSHTLLSSYTNIRLDNYIYTVEAFREALKRLAPRGLLYVSFVFEQQFIGERLQRNLTEAFGRPPLAFEGLVTESIRYAYLLSGPATEEPGFEEASGRLGLKRVAYAAAAIVPSTDAWPFLHLDRPRLPPLMSVLSGVILVLASAFALRARPKGEPFDGQLFWLGAAFMLLEVHNVSRLALVFGTTWQVNAWVIGVILGLILLANFTCARLQPARRAPARRLAIGALFVCLLASYVAPLDVLAGHALGGIAATLLLCSPIFCAGVIFAECFSTRTRPGFALGWNVLGALAGGLAENLSYLVGVPGLIPLAAACYGLAFLWPGAAAALRSTASPPAG
jgi:SAM-dependent methyltransferase